MTFHIKMLLKFSTGLKEDKVLMFKFNIWEMLPKFIWINCYWGAELLAVQQLIDVENSLIGFISLFHVLCVL